MHCERLIMSRLREVVGAIDPDVFQLRKVLEVKWAMLVVIEPQGGVDLDVDWPLLNAAKGASHEAVVPYVVFGDQEVPADLVTEQ